MSLVVQICGYSVTRKHSNKNRNVAAHIPAGPPQVSPPAPPQHPSPLSGKGMNVIHQKISPFTQIWETLLLLLSHFSYVRLCVTP